MSDWMTDALVEKTREFLGENPEGDKRAQLARLLDITEFKARQLIRRASVSGPTWGIWDLETTALEGHFGRLLCGSILSYPDMEMVTHSWPDYAEDPSEDGHLAVAIRDEIEKHQFSCGYYTKGFDFGFLNARLLAAGERLIKPHLHLDCIWAFRGWRGPKIGSSRMSNVAEYLGLEQKMKLPKEVWVKAGMGNKAALRQIIERCESDVRITWDIAQYVLDNKILKNPLQMYP
jgi:uncharacterized protein YprB with RNaseH-like and TPR domain